MFRALSHAMRGYAEPYGIGKVIYVDEEYNVRKLGSVTPALVKTLFTTGKVKYACVGDPWEKAIKMYLLDLRVSRKPALMSVGLWLNG